MKRTPLNSQEDANDPAWLTICETVEDYCKRYLETKGESLEARKSGLFLLNTEDGRRFLLDFSADAGPEGWADLTDAYGEGSVSECGDECLIACVASAI